jgi:squalene synthase HpnC
VVTATAYARCQQLAQQHYENFPVASRLLPKATRPYIAAIYAFARIADDFADEGTRTPEARLALLGDWQQRLDAAVAGSVQTDDSDAGAIFLALSDTIARFGLERSLFDDLLDAFRQDVRVSRYENWDDLLDYCRRSANPVGRLVLRIAGYRSVQLDMHSDAVCTALQLTNFWQDIEGDLKKGRLYVPLSVVRETGADIEDLRRARFTPAWTAALERAAAETRRHFAEGRGVADLVSGRLRWELRATWLGGTRILDRLASRRFDVFKSRPTLGWADAGVIAVRTLLWRRSAATNHAGPATQP